MRNKQMEINASKNLPFFKISRTHAEKLSLFREKLGEGAAVSSLCQRISLAVRLTGFLRVT